jgi:hypothetical protein
LSGKNRVQSNDIGPGAQVKASDVVDDSLTGADIKDKSGVDTCVITARLGQLCVRAENFDRPWIDAARHCANLDLRLPTVNEALELATTHDIPNVDESESFWTGGRYLSGTTGVADVVDEAGTIDAEPLTVAWETVCVTTPTN